jgi:hypothetical protein
MQKTAGKLLSSTPMYVAPSKILPANRSLLLHFTEFTYQVGFGSLERLVDAQNGERDES